MHGFGWLKSHEKLSIFYFLFSPFFKDPKTKQYQEQRLHLKVKNKITKITWLVVVEEAFECLLISSS
jgi:hypothetical protein